MNVELLKEVRKHILERPWHLDMARWIDEADEECVKYDLDNKMVLNCGTTACIAGHAVAISKTPVESLDWIPTVARDLLELSQDAASRLFHVGMWPDQFGQRFARIESNWELVDDREVALAKIAAERIDWFIKTNGNDVLKENDQ